MIILIDMWSKQKEISEKIKELQSDKSHEK